MKNKENSRQHSEKEAYLRSILRRIKAPAKIRERIRMDLLTEMEAQEETGASFAEIAAEKGDPAQVAASFNETYSGTEVRRRYYWEKGLLILSVLFFSMAAVLLLCSAAAGQLAAWEISPGNAGESTVGIIGGADGPTQIYVSASGISLFSLISRLTIFGSIVLLMGALCLLAFWLLRRKL